MRGLWAAKDPFFEAMEQLADNRQRTEKVFIPEKTPSSYLAWNFDGKVKFLSDCTKEELLYVCEVLCKKLESPQSSSLSDSMPSSSAA